MLFVKVDDLKPGMRLGKPIYNKNGVLLHERNSKLTMQAIYGIRNFGLLGLYILEPAEPVPPMSEEDILFERFQTMAVFSIKEDLDLICSERPEKTIDWLASIVIKNYGQLDHKINFVQSLRTQNDHIYKHSLNVAILTAVIAGQMELAPARKNMLIHSALMHDCGRLLMPLDVDEEADLDENEMRKQYEIIGNNTNKVLEKQQKVEEDVRLCIRCIHSLMAGKSTDNRWAKIIYVADAYDRMTAMKSYEEPTSEVKAIRNLLDHEDLYPQDIVNSLIKGINVLYPGVCVELTNKEKGLVITENKENLFEPYILCFGNNKLLDLSSSQVRNNVQILDVMKTMDNRIKIDRAVLDNYLLQQ